MSDQDYSSFIGISIVLLIINAIIYFLGLFPKDDFFKPVSIGSLIAQFFILLFIFFLGFTWMLYSQPGGSYQWGNNRVYTPGSTIGPLFQLAMIFISIGGIYWNFITFFGAGLFGVVALIGGRCLYDLIDKENTTKKILNFIGIISMVIGLFSIILAIVQYFGFINLG